MKYKWKKNREKTKSVFFSTGTNGDSWTPLMTRPFIHTDSNFWGLRVAQTFDRVVCLSVCRLVCSEDFCQYLKWGGFWINNAWKRPSSPPPRHWVASPTEKNIDGGIGWRNHFKMSVCVCFDIERCKNIRVTKKFRLPKKFEKNFGTKKNLLQKFGKKYFFPTMVNFFGQIFLIENFFHKFFCN